MKQYIVKTELYKQSRITKTEEHHVTIYDDKRCEIRDSDDKIVSALHTDNLDVVRYEILRIIKVVL